MEGVAEEGAVHDGAAQGQLVGVFNLVANAHAARQNGDFHVRVRCQAAEDIEIGRVALHRRAKGEDDFLDAAGLDALFKAIHLDVAGAYAVHGRDESAQDMVKTIVLMGVLDAHHILDVLDHADGRSIAWGVAADGTHLGLADVVAHLAIANLAPQLDDGFAKVDRLFLVLFQQVQDEAERRFTPDSRQLGKLADRRFQ